MIGTMAEVEAGKEGEEERLKQQAAVPCDPTQVCLDLGGEIRNLICEFPAFWPPPFCLDPHMHTTSYSLDLSAPVCAQPFPCKEGVMFYPLFLCIRACCKYPPTHLFDEELLDLSQFIISDRVLQNCPQLVMRNLSNPM